jgi:hypothetical protein
MKLFKADVTGRQPVYLNDFTFMQNASTEVIKSILDVFKPLNNQFILSGCEITLGSPITVSAGFVVINGEVCEFLGGSVPTFAVGQSCSYIAETVNLPNGTRLFQNGSTNEVYVSRNAKLASVPLTDNSYDNVPRFKDLLRNSVQSVSPSFTVFSSYLDVDFFPGQTLTTEGLIDADGFTRFKGLAYVEDLDVGNVVFNIPVGYRPLVEINYPSIDQSGLINLFKIKPNGDVVLAAGGGGSLSICHLDQIPPFRVY